MKTTDNSPGEFLPGEFLFDVAGGAYLIVGLDHFVDWNGVLFRFADYVSFSKTAVYAESVKIETGKPQQWKDFAEGTIVVRGQALCVRTGRDIFEIYPDKISFAEWGAWPAAEDVLVEPLTVSLACKDYKYVWKPR